MKNTKINSIVALMGIVATSHAKITLADDLSLSGYIYAAADYLDLDPDADITTDVELETILDYSLKDTPVSFHAEIAFIGTDAAVGGDILSENVILSYQLSEELSVGAGRILSYQGYDTFDQNTRAQRSFGWLSANSPYYDAFANGVTANYKGDGYALGAFIKEGSNETDDVEFEFLLEYSGFEGLFARVIIAFDEDSKTTYNAWAAYTFGDTTIGGEFITNQFEEIDDLTAYMVNVSQAFGDFGVTARFVATDHDAEFSGEKYTIAPYYKVTENVTIRGELTFEEYDDIDSRTLASVEAFLNF